MISAELQLIRQECEKIELDPKFGEVVIKIQNGHITVIQPTPTILIRKVDSVKKV